MIIFLWLVLIGSLLALLAIPISKLPGSIEKRPKGKFLLRAESFGAFAARQARSLLAQIWHFILEAKDLTPPLKINQPLQKVRQAFRIPIRTSAGQPQSLPEAARLVSEAKADDRSAEQIYLEAIKKNPSDAEAYEGLGRLYLHEKNYSEAIEVFSFLTKLNPEYDVYWSNLGVCLYSTKAYVQAAAAYEKALNINSKMPARWVNLSLCFKMIQQEARAIKALQNALNIDPRNLNYLMLLADSYIAIENKVRAEEVLDRILELDPTNRLAGEKLMALKI